MYEVTLSIQRLVNKYGNELWDPTWSIILDIIEKVIAHTGKICTHFTPESDIGNDSSNYSLYSLFRRN